MFFSVLKPVTHARTQPSSHVSPRSKHRNRLQKSPPIRQPKASLYSCKEIKDLERFQTCLNLLSNCNEGKRNVRYPSTETMQLRGQKRLFHDSARYNVKDPGTVYAPHLIEELDVQRWRNAKTPVFGIGQLEMKDLRYHTEATTEDLARIYQSLLPSPPVTPLPDFMKSSPKPERIRRMKSQHSLRAYINVPVESPTWTETETLCSENSVANVDERFSELSSSAKNPGIDLCLGLLTCELAGIFFQQHPKEHQDRASKLQIQLMIEGYEDVLYKLQHSPGILQKMGLSAEDLITTEKIIHHWLEVLYYLYDLADGLSLVNM